MGDEQTLLETYKPFLRYDSNEGYFTDSADEMTDAPGNRLRAADGTVIAEVGPDEPSLLRFLVPAGTDYPGTSIAAAKGDALSIASHDYHGVYRAVRAAHPEFRNIVYGRVAGADPVWLQYWFFSFYNDMRAGDIGLGLHEGDWEGIELRLGADGEPDLAVYAQHTYGEARLWGHVHKHAGRPVVYVALGSHASYFDSGMPLTSWHRTEAFVDRTDGQLVPKSDVTLELLSDPGHEWTRWPGRWGDTHKPTDDLPIYEQISGDSPVGPGINPRWKSPGQLLDAARQAGRAPGVPHPLAPPALAAPAPVTLQPERVDGRLRLRYEVAPSPALPPPTHLLVTLNSPDDPYPPTTFDLDLEGMRGTVEVPHELDPAHAYELRCSGVSAAGAPAPAKTARLAPADAGRPRTTAR